MTPPSLKGSLPGLGRQLTDREAVTVDKYLILLVKWQGAQRLVGSTDREWLVQNVVLDSFSFLPLIPQTTAALVDIGSGAGIPGIPIAVVRPQLSVVLVEPKRKRASFLSTAARELGLANVRVVERRVEQLGPAYDRRFDIAVMRCAGATSHLLAHAKRLVAPPGAVLVAASPSTTTDDNLGGELLTETIGPLQRHVRRWIVAVD